MSDITTTTEASSSSRVRPKKVLTEEQRAKNREYAKRYYQANKEKYNEYSKKRRAANPGGRKEEHAKYYAKYKERENARVLKWQQEHPENHRASTKRYYENNKEKVAEAYKKRVERHRERVINKKREKGGQCEKCDTAELKLLLFARKNGVTDMRPIADMHSYTNEKFEAEADKARLLCHNCHHLTRYDGIAGTEDSSAKRARINAAKQEMGGKCRNVLCGTTDMRVLQFDHIDPASKSCEVMTVVDDPEAFAVEVAKCQLLCANCHHLKTHYPDDPLLRIE